jgi:hypothetical protein
VRSAEFSEDLDDNSIRPRTSKSDSCKNFNSKIQKIANSKSEILPIVLSKAK